MAEYLEADATFSDCMKYRRVLWRVWEPDPGWERRALWVCVNPSIAAERDDPSVRKMVGFSKRFGCAGLHLLNVYDYIATDPAELRRAKDPIGPERGSMLSLIDGHVKWKVIIAGWGSLSKLPPGGEARVQDLWWRLFEAGAQCLGHNQDGSPAHPLMLGYGTPLVPL